MLFHPGFHGAGRRNTCRAEQVVTAAVSVAVGFQRLWPGAARLLTQARQRIELAKDGNHRLAAARTGDKRRIDATHAAFHSESLFCQRIRKQG